MLFYGEAAFAIARHSYSVSSVLHAGIRYSKSVNFDDASLYFLLFHHLLRLSNKQHNHHIYAEFNLHVLNTFLFFITLLFLVILSVFIRAHSPLH